MINAHDAGTARRRGVAILAALLVALVGLGVFGGTAVNWLRGYAIYHGRLAIAGRVGGHDFDLPAETLRCAGCHEAPSRELTQNSQLSLDLRELTKPRSRRGGPASAYTAESFCVTLRTGFDPGAIMLARAMPRFDVSDGDCRALWTFLGAR